LPKKLRIELSQDQRQELNRLALLPNLAPRFRLRLEMIRLSDLGLSVAQIAAALQAHHQTVGKFLNAFLAAGAGFEALQDKPHPGVKPKLLATHLAELETELDRAAAGQRTYTMPQLVEWLQTNYGLKVSQGHLSRVLRQRGFSWKRTKTSLQHKKTDPQLQAAKQADLETLT